MKLKDILKELENLKNNEEKISYLKESLKEIDDEELIKSISQLIEELEEDLEDKLDNIIIPVTRKREIELDEVEHEIETEERRITPQRPVTPRISLQDLEEEKEIRYDFSTSTYQTRTVAPIYQNTSPQLFTKYESVSLHDQADVKMIEHILVKEKDFTPGSSIDESKRSEIRDTIDNRMPHLSTEEKINVENQIMYDMRFTNEKNKDLKYITKLK